MDVVGVTKVRNCCTFLWMQDAHASRRVVFARSYHCAACVAEMVRSANLQRITIARYLPMERARQVFAHQKQALIERWKRQLQAAADAGSPLDPGTELVLPGLLDAMERTLEQRPSPAAAAATETERAAVQCGLLGDFLFDTVLETCPEMSAAAQRLLSAALARSSVEVLVRAALQKEREARRRENQRMVRLVHGLRSSVTAAGLTVDLLRRKGELADSRTVRALDQSLARLRDQVEEPLLDEVLNRGELRRSRVPLGPVLARTHSAANELGALAKKVTILLEKPESPLAVLADPRIVGPAIRGLLRAAVQLAEPGSTIRFGAAPARERARVAASLDAYCKLPGNRLPSLPALGFARRAARVHGGSLSTRVSPRDGCQLRLDLPRAHPV